ncbi:MAG: hypothetical protein AB1405_07690, partial [Bdellovibrionota bacterium]
MIRKSFSFVAALALAAGGLLAFQGCGSDSGGPVAQVTSTLSAETLLAAAAADCATYGCDGDLTEEGVSGVKVMGASGDLR